MQVVPHGNNEYYPSNLQPYAWLEFGCRGIKHCASHENGKVECREVMMQEELSRHKEERQIMKRPAGREESAKLIVLDQGG
jgi:hypothetical protein